MPLKFFVTVLIASVGFQAYAGDCELTIDRTACPGKKSEAYDPYQGKNPTVENKSAANEKACLDAAKKACRIVRKDILAKKTVAAKFDGKSVGSVNNCESVKDASSDCAASK